MYIRLNKYCISGRSDKIRFDSFRFDATTIAILVDQLRFKFRLYVNFDFIESGDIRSYQIISDPIRFES